MWSFSLHHSDLIAGVILSKFPYTLCLTKNWGDGAYCSDSDDLTLDLSPSRV